MTPIFKEQKIQEEFNRNGFVKIPFISSEQVGELRSYYEEKQFDNKIEAGFHISLDNQNTELVKEVSEKIKSCLKEQADQHFLDYQIFTASYVSKEPGKQNIVPPHQDWTFVDEEQYCSASVWTPLQDVSEENGALAVIKGSQHLFKCHRMSPSPQAKSKLSDHIFTLFPFTEVIEMKAGEALVFDNRLIHASPPNLNEAVRISVGIGICSNKAQLIHYHQDPNFPEKLNLYEVDADFFLRYNNKRLSDLYDVKAYIEGYPIVKSIAKDQIVFTKEEMEEMIQQLEGVTYNKPFMKRLASLFNYKFEEKSETMEEAQQEPKEKAPENNQEYKDPRSFFQKYTPANIIKEIIWRLKGRPE